ncbi:tRNA (guanosine(37)-N1)-methyltransferase TrmD [Actinomycetospora lemnae]|uniref:tRNA (guanine-N(1)-)-methyltransferase n=1 Tax=Actinomycetospora lemnae TaxID=3019891 RepID=A0ABT5SPD7_9PSEU|nr:tRNA (guanosine(37)-N1)-methyltransferase TrmD [Actinomycetospora sp. DW7H6]MDD7964355.1 tRNA (guanosine(37)-N1)-methyltransferase TrmD [Actinomycetospora sp. DW7H6]
MRIDVVTIFPGYLAPLDEALVGRARRAGLLDVRVHDLRRWASGVHKAVDDAPYGGGPGMLMTAPVWGAALDEVTASGDDDAVPRLLVPTPAGAPLTQRRAAGWASEPWLVLACGRYEGIDARVLDDARRRMPVEEVSLGDYVLAGGEVAALVVVEAVSRLVPGVLGNPASAELDSFAEGTAGLLEAPAYTRPERWRDLDVPEVLRGGNHAVVDRWRRDRSLERTAAVRPDLLDALVARHGAAAFDARDREVLAACGYDPAGGARSAAWQTGEVAADGARPERGR